MGAISLNHIIPFFRYFSSFLTPQKCRPRRPNVHYSRKPTCSRLFHRSGYQSSTRDPSGFNTLTVHLSIQHKQSGQTGRSDGKIRGEKNEKVLNNLVMKCIHNGKKFNEFKGLNVKSIFFDVFLPE